MIFDDELRNARARIGSLDERLLKLAEARAKAAARRDHYARCFELFEYGLAEARAQGRARELPVYWTPRWKWDRRSPQQSTSFVNPGDERQVRKERDSWDHALTHLGFLLERIDRKVEELKRRRSEIEFWVLEKEETWGRVDRETLKRQVRDILVAADELSQFVVGRKVPVEFDTRDESPLGYVPIHKHKTAGRRVYLSAKFLGEQPEHLLDYYRALVVHELGHLLLHLKESAREYRKLRRLFKDRILRAPQFFAVVNTLWDEQLERVLRATKPQWQGWFNRLDFYARRIPVRVLKAQFARAGQPDPDATLADLAARRLVKVYPDPKQPFAVIQSAAVFSENLGFTKFHAFFSSLREQLPRASVAEPWLTECLDLIPKDFKTLDVFELHDLAVAIYKILTRGEAGAGFVTVRVNRSGKDRATAIELPGEWIADGDPTRGRVVELRGKRGGKGRGGGGGDGAGSNPTPPASGSPPPTAEGEPPPPPTSPPRPKPPKPPKPKKTRHANAPSGGYTPVSRPLSELPAWAFPKPKDRPKAKATSSEASLTRRQKARRQNATRKQQMKFTWGSAKPDSGSSPPPLSLPPEPPEPQVTGGLLAGPGAWSPRGTNSKITRLLNDLVNQVRAEMAGPPAEPVLDRIVPDAGRPTDARDETDTRDFPPAPVLTLNPDRRANLALARAARPLVNVLRPYLAVSDPSRLFEERLAGGRRLLGGMLTRHLAYGETRLFADHRPDDAELYAEVFVGVLIDTSASMGTDGRLDRAKLAAAALAGCLRECVDVASVFVGYNEFLYRCGTHDAHSLGSLAPAGRTNEAAALDRLAAHHLGVPRRRKAVVVFTDGLPTACSVESVRHLVRSLEKERGVRYLHAALSAREHPAYSRRVDLAGDLDPARVRALGRSLAALLA